MTDQELHDAIQANAEAKALADAGNDEGCAALIGPTLPKVLRETRVTYLGIMAEGGPALGARLITSVRAVVASGHVVLSPVLDEVQHSLRDSGVDIAHAATRSTLDTLASLQVPNGLTAEDAATIKAMAEYPQTIDPRQVSRAWATYRGQG